MQILLLTAPLYLKGLCQLGQDMKRWGWGRREPGRQARRIAHTSRKAGEWVGSMWPVQYESAEGRLGEHPWEGTSRIAVEG